MATAPAYANVPVTWCALAPGTADTSFTSPTAVNQLGTAGTNGTKITQIDVTPAGTVVAGLINVFLWDGAAYHVHEQVPITAAGVNATTAGTKQTYTYDNLAIPSGWALRITTTVSGNASLVEVNAFGANL